MYALLTNPETHLPTVMNVNSFYYPDLIQKGYEPIVTGTKKEVNEIYEALIVEFASNLD